MFGLLNQFKNKTTEIYNLIETLKSIQKQKENKMADRTVRTLATILDVSPEELLTEVRKVINMATLDTVLNDEKQTNLLLDYASQIQKTSLSSTMPEELLKTRAKLDLLYQYEKHYLELIKEYKEEIKFAGSMQEDLRRERSQFFTQTLREVVQTLQAQEIDKKVASQWIEELVASYTKSIDLSSDLAKTHVVQVLSIFKEEAKQEVSKAKLDNFGTNSSKVVDAE